MSSASKDHQHNKKEQPSKLSDAALFVICIAVVVAALVFVPTLVGKTQISFLSEGSGLNKAVAIIAAVVVGWLALLPTGFYKRSVSLMKGAIIEWRKSVKPTKDEVVKTTMIVLAVVFVAAIGIAFVDWLLFNAFNSFIR